MLTVKKILFHPVFTLYLYIFLTSNVRTYPLLLNAYMSAYMLLGKMGKNSKYH